VKYIHSIFIAGLLSAFLASGSIAQTMNEDVAMAQIELARAIAQEQTLAVIEANLPLTAEEREAFGPLYQEYAAEKRVLNDRLLEIIVQYSEMFNTGEIDDRTADRLMSDYFKLRKDKVSLKQKQFRKFKRALPTAKAVQFFQIDNRIDTLVDVGLASQIPLILE